MTTKELLEKLELIQKLKCETPTDKECKPGMSQTFILFAVQFFQSGRWGIPTIRRTMQEYHLPQPEFLDERRSFIAMKGKRIKDKDSVNRTRIALSKTSLQCIIALMICE